MKRLIKKSFKNKVKDIQLLINIFKKQLVKESSVDLKKLTEAFNFLMDKNEFFDVHLMIMEPQRYIENLIFILMNLQIIF